MTEILLLSEGKHVQSTTKIQALIILLYIWILKSGIFAKSWSQLFIPWHTRISMGFRAIPQFSSEFNYFYTQQNKDSANYCGWLYIVIDGCCETKYKSSRQSVHERYLKNIRNNELNGGSLVLSAQWHTHVLSQRDWNICLQQHLTTSTMR